jgi:MYXO-CTERM domain-containing protein
MSTMQIQGIIWVVAGAMLALFLTRRRRRRPSR